ncbi:MAG: hypothetical protein WEC84_00815 [Candidatus Andersenbacteria bacterium]
MRIFSKGNVFLPAVISVWTLPFTVSAAGITNPLNGIETVQELLTNIIQWLLGLVGLLALFALVAGGVKLIVSFGKEESVKSAKQIITWAVIGLIVVIASYALIAIVSGFLGAGPAEG